jgi:hypothetical protein
MTPEEILYAAIDSNSLPLAKKAIKLGADPNDAGSDPFYTACENKKTLGIARFLAPLSDMVVDARHYLQHPYENITRALLLNDDELTRLVLQKMSSEQFADFAEFIDKRIDERK